MYRCISKLLILGILMLPVTTAAESTDATIQRLASGIEHWKRSGASGRWWSCGKIQENGSTIATELATQIVTTTQESGLNPWGLAGIFAKESAFDECALGKKSRDLGYREGILKRNKLTISHTAEDVLKVIDSKAWKKEVGKADLGLPQIMYPTVYKGDPAKLLEREFGVTKAVEEMVKRTARLGEFVKVALLRPWGTWPGWYDTEYDKSVIAYARRLGATPDDIASPPKGPRTFLRHTTL